MVRARAKGPDSTYSDMRTAGLSDLWMLLVTFGQSASIYPDGGTQCLIVVIDQIYTSPFRVWQRSHTGQQCSRSVRFYLRCGAKIRYSVCVWGRSASERQAGPSGARPFSFLGAVRRRWGEASFRSDDGRATARKKSILANSRKVNRVHDIVINRHNHP